MYNTGKKIDYSSLDNEIDDFFEGSNYNNSDDKKMNILKQVFSWALWSSVNTDKISLSIKAGLPLLVLWGISDTETLNNLTGSIGELVVLIGQVITGVLTVWGLLRKIWFTMR